MKISGPRNHQAEHLPGVQQALGARLDRQPSPFCKSQLGESTVALSEGDPMQCEVLRGNLAQGLLADRACPLATADIGDTDMQKGLSQELPTQADVRTQCLGETSNEVFKQKALSRTWRSQE